MLQLENCTAHLPAYFSFRMDVGRHYSVDLVKATYPGGRFPIAEEPSAALRCDTGENTIPLYCLASST